MIDVVQREYSDFFQGLANIDCFVASSTIGLILCEIIPPSLFVAHVYYIIDFADEIYVECGRSVENWLITCHGINRSCGELLYDVEHPVTEIPIFISI